MEYYTGTKDISLSHTVVALGKFDGLHLGHQTLFKKLLEYGRQGYKTVIFTFDFHPNSLLSGKLQSLIYTRRERLNIALDMGVDVLIEYPFTEETSHMSPEAFVRDVLVRDIGAEYIVVGDDFHFGYKRAGDVAFLKAHEESFGYKVDNCKKLCYLDREISASLIREYVAKGDMETAAMLLGRPYSVEGVVIKGRSNGRKVNMPTANVAPSEDKLLPPDGVYATKTWIPGYREPFISLTNIGRNPTVGDHNALRVETYILNFSDSLYSKTIKVDFYKWIRGERKFESLEVLRSQVARDQLEVTAWFEAHGDEEARS